jgi:hypothetical protein
MAYEGWTIDGDLTTATIAEMTRMAGEDAASFAVRSLPADPDALFSHVQRRIRYRTDAESAAPLRWRQSPELLIAPATLLSLARPADDCDGFSMVIASRLLSLGIPVAFRTIAADPSHPGAWSHVYPVAWINGHEVAMDASHGTAPGWEASEGGITRWGKPVTYVGRKQDWRIPPMEVELGAIDWGSILADAIPKGVDAGAGVLLQRYGNPPEGVYRTTGADGSSTVFRQPAGASALAFPGVSLGGNGGNSMVALLGLGLIAALLLSRK